MIHKKKVEEKSLQIDTNRSLPKRTPVINVVTGEKQSIISLTVEFLILEQS